MLHVALNPFTRVKDHFVPIIFVSFTNSAWYFTKSYHLNMFEIRQVTVLKRKTQKVGAIRSLPFSVIMIIRVVVLCS